MYIVPNIPNTPIYRYIYAYARVVVLGKNRREKC